MRVFGGPFGDLVDDFERRRILDLACAALRRILPATVDPQLLHGRGRYSKTPAHASPAAPTIGPHATGDSAAESSSRNNARAVAPSAAPAEKPTIETSCASSAASRWRRQF